MKAYHIPHNFGKEGNIGQFSLRAVIECGVYVAIEIIVLLYLPFFKPVTKFFIGTFLVMITVPLVLFWGDIETPSELLVRMFKYRTSERKYGVPSNAEVAEREHRIIKKMLEQRKAMRAEERKASMKILGKRKKAEADEVVIVEEMVGDVIDLTVDVIDDDNEIVVEERPMKKFGLKREKKSKKIEEEEIPEMEIPFF